MFRQMHEAMPEGGSIGVAITKPEEGRLVATVTPVFPEGKGKDAKSVSLSPLRVSGTVEEMEVEFPTVLDKFAAAMKDFNSNLPDVLAEMEAKGGGKGKKGKDKAPAAPEPPDRKVGELDEKLAATLAGQNGGKDMALDPFQKALRTANLATLEAALPKACGLLRQKTLGREIAEISGKEIAEVLKPVLIAAFKANQAAATNVALPAAVRQPAVAAMDKIAEELTRLTGKDLASMGLDPAQGQLIEDGAGAGDETAGEEGA
jgi:PRTRC genetic system protein E